MQSTEIALNYCYLCSVVNSRLSYYRITVAHDNKMSLGWPYREIHLSPKFQIQHTCCHKSVFVSTIRSLKNEFSFLTKWISFSMWRIRAVTFLQNTCRSLTILWFISALFLFAFLESLFLQAQFPIFSLYFPNVADQAFINWWVYPREKMPTEGTRAALYSLTHFVVPICVGTPAKSFE